MTPASIPAHEAFLGRAAGRVHNEAAFRYFLDIERRRADRSAQAILVVLVSRRVGRTRTIEPATAAGIFSALAASVREADLIGWYRQDLVAGAVLIQPVEPPSGIRQLVSNRVAAALRLRLLEQSETVGFRVLVVSLRRKG